MTTMIANVLPASLPPRMLSGKQAAAFCGLTIRQFNKALKTSDDLGEPVLPSPILLGGQKLWHTEQLGRRLDALAGLGAETCGENEAEKRVRRWLKSK